jgi:regulatory protein spx
VAGLVNPKSQGLKKLNVNPGSLSDQEAADLLNKNPKVMFRPLLTDGRSLVLGFKPEQMEKLIG